MTVEDIYTYEDCHDLAVELEGQTAHSQRYFDRLTFAAALLCEMQDKTLDAPRTIATATADEFAKRLRSALEIVETRIEVVLEQKKVELSADLRERLVTAARDGARREAIRIIAQLSIAFPGVIGSGKDPDDGSRTPAADMTGQAQPDLDAALSGDAPRGWDSVGPHADFTGPRNRAELDAAPSERAPVPAD